MGNGNGMDNRDGMEVALERIAACKRKRSVELDLSGLGLREIPAGVGELIWLKGLRLNENKISKIEGLNTLSKLQRLYLSSNQISKIEGLNALSKLQELYLSSSQISKIEGLDQLVNLQGLNFSNNPIRSLKPLFEPTFHLGKIKTDLTSSVFPHTKGLIIHNCFQLTEPSLDIVNSGIEVIESYFHAIKEQGSRTFNEAKLMIVGQEDAGKTSLSQKLKNKDNKLPTANSSTSGIAVTDWNYNFKNEDYTVHIWDFGGQDIQYAIHQFFMTSRTIYILVDRGRNQTYTSLDNHKSDYWLEIIKRLANASTTFYFYNKFSSCLVNNDYFNALSSAETYPFLQKKSYLTDLTEVGKQEKANRELESLRLDLKDAIQALPNVGLVLPKKWAAVRVKLAEVARQEPFITFKEYQKYCRESGINDKKIMLFLSQYLHELGSIIHYSSDKNSSLYNHVILRREWATDAIYALVLDDVIINEKNGRFNEEDLNRIWSKENLTYNYEDCFAILRKLLERFEICYSLDKEKGIYLAPQCLSTRIPKALKQLPGDAITLHYNYDLLPYGLVNRLSVRLHDYILNPKKDIWRYGVRLQEANGKGGSILVKVESSGKNGKITLSTSGNKGERHFLQQLVLKELRILNRKMNIFNSSRIEVPCICELCKNSKEPYYHEYDYLKGVLEDGSDQDERCKKSRKKVKILDLIDHAFYDKRPEEIQQTLEKKSPLERLKDKPVVIQSLHTNKFSMQVGDKTVKGDEIEGNQTVQGNKIGGNQIVNNNSPSTKQPAWYQSSYFGIALVALLTYGISWYVLGARLELKDAFLWALIPTAIAAYLVYLFNPKRLPSRLATISALALMSKLSLDWKIQYDSTGTYEFRFGSPTFMSSIPTIIVFLVSAFLWHKQQQKS